MIGKLTWPTTTGLVVFALAAPFMLPWIKTERDEDLAWFKGGRGEVRVSRLLHQLEPEGTLSSLTMLP